jgi:lipoprotein signal peptidase
MQRADRLPGKRWQIAFFLVALLVAVADQLTKHWVRSCYEGEPLFELGFLRIVHVQNTGAAFGIFQDQNLVLTVVAVIGIVLVLTYIFFIARRYPFLATRTGYITFGLIMGGAIGNLIDRLFRGHVTDFIDVGFWPTFNVADSAVDIGVVIFAISFIFLHRKLGGEEMTAKKHFTAEEAKQIGESLGIDWSKFDVEQYRMGLDVELEHGLQDPATNVTNDDPVITGKIALAHLNEFADYYTRLEKMEREAEGK